MAVDLAKARAAYQRGLREGVEIAKREAYVDDSSGEDACCTPDTRIDWTGVDAELARRLGDAHE